MSASADTNFLTHLEALRQALWRGVAAIALLLIPGFFAAPHVLSGLVRFTCPPDFKLNYFSPMEPLLVQLKLGLVLAIVAAMPVILWQTVRFVTPALYQNERRAVTKALAAVLLLFLCGAAIGLFLVAPLMMHFSASYASESLAPIIGISGFVNLIGLLILSFGIMFQLPVVLVLLMRLGVVEVETLRKSRPIAVTAIFVVAAILTPPDVVSQMLLGIPTWLLFEASLLFGAKSSRRRTEDADETAPAVSKTIKSEPPEPLDAVYRNSSRRNRRKNRRFGAINGHYHKRRSEKK